jgi:hypothetical protein
MSSSSSSASLSHSGGKTRSKKKGGLEVGEAIKVGEAIIPTWNDHISELKGGTSYYADAIPNVQTFSYTGEKLTSD